VSHWARVFEAQFDYVYRSLRRYGVNAADAEDLCQEVFLVMWRRRTSYDPVRPLRPWIAGIAFRVIQERRRRSQRELPGGLLDMPDQSPRPDERLASAQAQALVLAALARLPEKQRAIVILHDIDGLAMRDIADALTIPLFTLYSRLKAGRAKFAKEIRRATGRATLGIARLEALLASERVPPRAPARARQRVIERMRALMLDAPPASSPAPSIGRGPLIVGAAVAVAVALLVWLPAGRSAGPPAAAEPGLVGHWRFDEAPGSLLARDHSGQRNDCFLRRLDPAAAWAAGALGGALHLDGRGWLECPRAQALAGLRDELTIAAWVTRGTALRNYHALVARQKGSGRLDEFMFGFANGELLFASHSWKGKLVSPLPADLGPWLHVAVTRRRDGAVVLFAGGREIGRGQTDAGILDGGTGALIIGGARNGPDPSRIEARFDGGLDELLLFDRALAPGEIAQLAARPRPVYEAER
jgi:RNA polymerase sigma-70 factor (ECF subfamily)